MIYGLADKLKPGICNKVLTDHPPARHRQPLQDWYLLPLVQYKPIVAPSAVCATGLRPTFGVLPELGAWTLLGPPTIGPICRSAEDCDGTHMVAYDRASRTMPLTIRIRLNLKPKVAYAKNYIDSLPDNSPEKLSELCRMQVYRWYWFSIQLT
jgi:hypothetical protein